MTRPIVYIAAPFGAPTQAEREWNTARAELLCLLAQRSGCAPICVHSGVLRGAYGDDDVPSTSARTQVGTWRHWGIRLAEHGLLERWEALREKP